MCKTTKKYLRTSVESSNAESLASPSAERGKASFPLPMESQEAFKDLLLSENTSSLLSFLSCLARKIPKKMSGPPLDKEGEFRLICVHTLLGKRR